MGFFGGGEECITFWFFISFVTVIAFNSCVFCFNRLVSDIKLVHQRIKFFLALCLEC
jgi:hypothetical protein